MQLLNKRAIVTGGSSGIGAATVAAYVREGAAVVSLDINDDAGREIAEKSATDGPGSAIYLHCDISKQDQVEQVFSQAVAHLGGLDVLANIAGNEAQKPAENVTEADIDKLFNVHVKGTMFSNAAAFKTMRADGGSIINAASGAGVTGYPGSAVYSAAKAAVLGYTRTVAMDWGKYLIRVNALLPAAVTAMTDAHFAGMDEETYNSYRELYRSKVPLGGFLGTVEQVAAMNVFLASDASNFTTGQMLAVDGGWTMVR